MNAYNRTVHKTTGHTPNEVFYSNNDLLFKEIHEKILENYKKNNLKDSLFSENEKCLLINSIIKTNQKAINGAIILVKNKIKNKNTFFKICVEIQNYINGGNYLIKIIGDYNIYDLYNEEIYCTNYNMLRKCDISIWNNLYKYINSKIDNINDKFDNKSNSLFSSDSDDNDMEMNSKGKEILKFTNEYNNLELKKRYRFNSY